MDHIFSKFLLLLKVKGRRGNDIVECLDHLEICSQVRAPQLRGWGDELVQFMLLGEPQWRTILCGSQSLFFFFFFNFGCLSEHHQDPRPQFLGSDIYKGISP